VEERGKGGNKEAEGSGKGGVGETKARTPKNSREKSNIEIY